MNSPTPRIKELLRKFEAERLSHTEEKELDAWYETIRFEDIPELEKDEFLDEGVFKEKYEDLLKRIRRKRNRTKIIRIGKRLAAAVIVLMAVSALYFVLADTGQRPAVKTNEIAKPANIDDILPGKKGAVLSLADGKKIALDSATQGNITQQGNIVINNSNGLLTYHVKERKAKDAGDDTQMNTLSTPSGYDYRLVLPDGSKVWLNASSSISFPVRFSKDSREVVLRGEAYFEVEKISLKNGRRKPFKITINSPLGREHAVQLEVLGTSFNVNAYANEPDIKTTLVNGRIKVTAADQSVVISPLQQSIISQNGKNHVISNADIQEALSWKDGLFYFNHTNIHAILRQFSRWYNVRIISKDSQSSRSFTGKISRSSKLADVLKIMDMSKINYSVKDQQIIIDSHSD